MDTYEKINEIIEMCEDRHIRCHLDSYDSANYGDKYVPIGDRIYDTIKSWMEIGHGRLMKQEISDLTAVWAKLSQIKNDKEFASYVKKYDQITEKGDKKVKNYNSSEATQQLLTFVTETEKVFQELMPSDAYSSVDRSIIAEAEKTFARMKSGIDTIIDGESKKAAALHEKFLTSMRSFQSNILSKNYVNNRSLNEAASYIEELMGLEHSKDKATREMLDASKKMERHIREDEFFELARVSELKARCANMFKNLDEKYQRINSAPAGQLSGITDEMQALEEQIIAKRREIKVRYQNAPEALKESIKMTGFAELRPLEEKKKRLESKLARGIGKLDQKSIQSFNRFYESMADIRDIYEECADFELSYFNMVFKPLLEVSRDGTTQFDVLNSIIVGGNVSEQQYQQVFQWLNITLPVMKQHYSAAIDLLEVQSQDYQSQFNYEGLSAETTTIENLQSRVDSAMDFLDEEEPEPETATTTEVFTFEQFDDFLAADNDTF